MQIDKRRFKKMFPYLAQEMGIEESEVSTTSIRSNTEAAEKVASRGFEGYSPDVIDFLRRCTNKNQAEEIIEYMEKKKEISREHAVRLRKQLREKGLRSFGPKKEDDYYLKQAGQ